MAERMFTAICGVAMEKRLRQHCHNTVSEWPNLHFPQVTLGGRGAHEMLVYTRNDFYPTRPHAFPVVAVFL